ncbi:unnamed protein product [Symbiodinium sp. CCMP2592]|nr:unnamed protein product [Symbiodinium sp. CCMP2592]
MAACYRHKQGLQVTSLVFRRSFFSFCFGRSQEEIELEKMKLENERMKLENVNRQVRLREQETSLREQETRLREQEICENQRVSEEGRRQSESDAATLKRPRVEMVQQAQSQVAHAPANEEDVLKELETNGFTFYSCPQYFVAEEGRVEQAANDALQQLPSNTRTTVARLMANTEESAGAQMIYEFKDGQGELTKLVYKVSKTGSKKAVAVMPFGASFQCAKVVKGHTTTKETVPVFADQPREQLAEKGFFTDTYKTVYERKQVGVKTVERMEPIFDEKVLSVDKQTEMMNALETRASRKVLKEIC